MKKCCETGCNVMIEDHHSRCKKHHAELMKKRRLARKMKAKAKKMAKPRQPSTRDLFDSAGRVRVGMGLSRLSREDAARREEAEAEQAPN